MKRYKAILLNEAKKKVLYHSTNKKNLPSILKHGLKTDSFGFIYLMEYPERWNDVVLEVTIPDQKQLMDWREAWYDDNGEEFDMDHSYDHNNPYWLYLSSIPAKYLRVLDEKEVRK